ncbi:hypothetical protein [Arthrobacter sp. SD76]|uniref:hypothetical protein n=1 Tax=Arthrobacter sp. SD76 TaxID=3415007 RepID=UPI003C72B154
MAPTAAAVLHDGSTIPVTIQGTGPDLLLPVPLAGHSAEEAETIRQWGADPDLGPNLVQGLSAANRVIAVDYEAHRMAFPAPDTLTPGNVTADLLAIADAAVSTTFAYYGYSCWDCAASSSPSGPTGSALLPWEGFRPSTGRTKACWP